MRTAVYRDRLYSKQIDVYIEMVSAMETMIADYRAAMLATMANLSEESTQRFRAEVNVAFQQFSALYIKWSILLPSNGSSAITAMAKCYQQINDRAVVARTWQDQHEHAVALCGDLLTASINARAAMRRALGVEALDAETVQIIRRLEAKEPV